MRITAEQLREKCTYDPDTGQFRFRTSVYKSKIGALVPVYVDKAGYEKIHLLGGSYTVHRLAWLYMTGRWPEGYIDHVNHTPYDNRFCNLRESTPTENRFNMRLGGAGTTGYLGVSKFAYGKFRATIAGADKKPHYLGSFDTAEEAFAVYMEAKHRLHPFAFASNSTMLEN